jgi:uncharacterized DUF497 family protein
MSFDFSTVEGFEWERGNVSKSAQKHQISIEETEEIFFRAPWVHADSRPGDVEPRFAAFACSERGRVLRVVFTIRNRRIRPISARPASREGRLNYEKALRERG